MTEHLANSNLALAPATGARSATALTLADPSVAVAVNSIPCRVTASFGTGPAVTLSQPLARVTVGLNSFQPDFEALFNDIMSGHPRDLDTRKGVA